MARNLDKPEAVGNIVLTDRDKLIIYSAYRFRLLTNDQIDTLTNSISRNKLNDRIRQLWAHDYIDRPEYQKELFSYGEKRPTINALGWRGADWLESEKLAQFPKSVNWRAKNKSLKSGDFIHHTLGTTDSMLKIEKDIHSVEGLRLVDKDEVWLTSPKYNFNRQKPFELPTVYNWIDGTRVNRRTIPDYIFGIVDRRLEQATKGLNFLEYDRSTESLFKTSSTQSSILQKYYGYADAYSRQLPKDLYGYGRFRVLFVVESGQHRVDSMIELYKTRAAKLIPAGSLLFTTLDDLQQHGFLAPIWLNGKREQVSIVPNTLSIPVQSNHLVQV
jgi:hypothetical protein